MIYAPVNDFPLILDENGQNIIIRRIVRTIDSNGKTTNITTNDIPVVAIVDEYKKISSDIVGASRYEIGDVKFSILPDITITYYDKIIWDGNTYVIKNIRNPTKISQEYLYKVIETGREKLI